MATFVATVNTETVGQDDESLALYVTIDKSNKLFVCKISTVETIPSGND